VRSQTGTNTWVEYEDAGRGRPVVLLHAFPLCRLQWRPQSDALQSDYRVLAPDLRGFGGTSPFDDAPSIERMADDVLTLLDSIGVKEPIVLGGLSMGGYVALAFARKHSHRLRGLILADTKAEPDDDEGRAKRDKLIAFVEKTSPRDLIDQLLGNLLGQQTRDQRPAVVEQVRDLAAAQTTAGVVAALQALRDRPDARPGLAKITVPTLVIVGTEDTVTPLAASQALVGAIAGARLATIEGAGHLANLEQPEAFNATLRAFLGKLG
jgi:pimeloyl-ACP methyl ester carboxylesterase